MDLGIDKKRIIKNTILLYGRMVLSLLINLYCSRVVLQTLGVIDYGVFNVVGGVIVLFTFISGPLSASTSRFLTFELGAQHKKRLNQVFSVSMLIHLVFGLLVCLVTETVGRWFVLNVLVIPAERLHAAVWVLHFSVVSIFFSLIQTPLLSDVISHERMDAFAAISLSEVILRLIVVVCLVYVSADKLIVYALMLSLISVMSFVAYWRFCRLKFEEAQGKRYYDKGVAKDLLSFMGWSLTGGISGICNSQGLNMLLNVFFGPAVNAARGVSMQVQNALTSFSSNIQQALNPQITISYASHRLDDMFMLMTSCARFTYLFLFILSLPIFCYTPYILTLWLGQYPPYTVEFVRIILIINLIESQSNTLVVANHATGRIKKFQIWVEAVNVLTLPLAYLYLRWISSENPSVVFLMLLLVSLAAQGIRIAIVLPNIGMSFSFYFRRVIVPLLKFSALMTVLGWGCVSVISSPNIYMFIIAVCILIMAGCLLTFLVVLSDNERNMIVRQYHQFLKKFRK